MELHFVFWRLVLILTEEVW